MMRRIVVLVAMAYCLSEVSARHLHIRCSTDTDQDFNCPYPSGLFSHEECGKFWHCSNCIAYEKNCPANLVWDRLYQTCNWINQVDITDCTLGDGSGGNNSTESGTNATDGLTDGTTAADNDDNTTTAQPEQPTTSAPEETTTESNEETTTDGEGEGTTANEETTVATEQTTDGTTEAVTEDTTSSGGAGSPPDCKSGQQYFPHEDCKKFWQCDNGVAKEQNCAPGTAWDQNLLTCNHEGLVNCADRQ